MFDAIKQRRTVRRFSSRKIEHQLLYQLLELSHLSPSAFNLQPWHFIIVRDTHIKEILYHIAMEQESIRSAQQIVVFAADTSAWKNALPRILELAESQGSLDAAAAARIKKLATAAFATGPLDLFGFLKKLALSIRRLRRPSPRIVTNRQESRFYARSQALIAAQTFMLAAASAGLATCPVESFDEERLKKLLALPRRMTIALLVAVGYPLEGEELPERIRLPLVEKVSVDLYSNKLSKLKPRT